MIRLFRFIKLLFILSKVFFLLGFSSNNKKLIQYGLGTKKSLQLQEYYKEFLLLLKVKIIFQGSTVQAPKMLVSNHISWLDVFVLGSVYKGHFIAKSEISSWPVLGPIITSAGTLYIKRGVHSAIKKMGLQIGQIIENKNNVLFFPEGQTSDGKQIKKIYSGLFESAIIAGMDVQPMLIIYSDSSGNPSRSVPYIDNQHLLSSIWNVLGEKEITVHLFALETISSKEYTRKEIGGLVSNLLSLKLDEEIKPKSKSK
jgi:1-acyl-sn-glycerol-3-phosphate acyltransferase